MGESRTRRKGKEGDYCPFLGFGRDRESFVETELSQSVSRQRVSCCDMIGLGRASLGCNRGVWGCDRVGFLEGVALGCDMKCIS